LRYILLIGFTFLCQPALAQVVVKPDARPIYIRIDSSPVETSSEVTSSKAESGASTNRVAELEKEVKELRALLEYRQKLKVPVIDVEPEMPKFAPYPTTPAARHWNMGNIPMTNANLIRHLMGEIGDPQHRGRFSREYLQYLASLENGNARLRALHSDDHDNVIRNGYVPGPPRSSFKATQRTVTEGGWTTVCPSGNCPRR